MRFTVIAYINCSPCGVLSWLCFLAARAMLMKADIMLLDEPTNHLDVKNVAWLEDYLTHLPDVTSMVVSHDSGFLDHVCTGIIHYENRKLKHYRVRSLVACVLLCLALSLLLSCADCPTIYIGSASMLLAD